jgi:DNA-binding protein
MPQEITDESINSVYVGKKETMIYVFSVNTQAQTQKEIHIRARGRSISKAVDVSQIVISRFLKNWEIQNTKLGTEEKEMLNESGQTKLEKISKIEIIIRKM